MFQNYNLSRNDWPLQGNISALGEKSKLIVYCIGLQFGAAIGGLRFLNSSCRAPSFRHSVDYYQSTSNNLGDDCYRPSYRF